MSDIVQKAHAFIKDQEKLKARIAEFKVEKKVKQKEYETIIEEAKKLCGATNLKTLKAELVKVETDIEDIMMGVDDDI